MNKMEYDIHMRNSIRWLLKQGDGPFKIKAMLNAVIQDQSRKVELIQYTNELAVEIGHNALAMAWEE